jgi:peptidoglycan/xylan/chitin deacetylase (PgdA/CDA1 family)
VNPRSIALMYHRVGSLPPDPADAVYALSEDEFTRQMDLVASLRLPVLDREQLESGGSGPGGVVLTFDDGCDSDTAVALPILRSRGFRALFFVSPALVGRPSYLSWSDIRALADAGMCVGTHGLDHTLLGGLPETEARRHLAESKSQLEERLGVPVDSVSLPGGSGGSRVAGWAREAGYRIVFGSQPGLLPWGRGTLLPRYALRRGGSLHDFQALLERRLSVRLGQSARYHGLGMVRRLLGEGRYVALQRVAVALLAGRPGRGGPAPTRSA